MPPNSTQNLNAKLGLTQVDRPRGVDPAPGFAHRHRRESMSQTKIVGGPRRYRGGYHLNV